MPQKSSQIGLAKSGNAPRGIRAQEQHEKHGIYVLAVLCVIAALVARFGFLNYPFYNDSGLYIYMGHRMLEHIIHGAHLSEYPGAFFSGSPGFSSSQRFGSFG